MQPRSFFARVGNGRPRSPTSLANLTNLTSLTKPKSQAQKSEHGIKSCMPPEIGYRNPDLIHRKRRLDIPLKHWHMCSSVGLRYFVTSRNIRQSDLRKSQDLSGFISWSGASSESDTEKDSRFNFPAMNNKQGLRRALVTKETALSEAEISSTVVGGHRSRRSIKKSIRRRILNPLSAWLDSTKRSSRERIWTDAFKKHLYEPKNFALPTILLCYLEGKDASAAGKPSSATKLNISVIPALQRSGFGSDDVDLWAYVLNAPTGDDAAQRFITNQSKIPIFVLLQLLRRSSLSTRSFRSLQTYSAALPAFRVAPPAGNSPPEITDVTSVDQALPLHSLLNSTKHDSRYLELTSFEVLICRLIYHARQHSPYSLVTISNMVVAYCWRHTDNEPNISSQLHVRLCRIYNMILHRLSLPASVQPMQSMTYNWEAQRRLLVSAAEFRPSLLLNRNAYRAVSRVLLACRKSSPEIRYAGLMQRTWPPWRKELDGMDVSRSPKEDTSRIVAALSRMKESGYAQGATDSALNILGGREPDGTPTIQTRQITKFRTPNPFRDSHASHHQNTAVEWAARITATRDVYEAWEAFQGFKRDGQRPSHSMYQAMFEKIIYRKMAGTLPQSQDALAGDAKEPLPVMDDNMSESEKLRKQPPSLDFLFSQMREDGVRPSGRCLEILISNAASLQKAASYMQHGAVPRHTLASLLRKPEMMERSSLKSIPYGTFSAFIQFLCRCRRWNLKTPLTILESLPIGNIRESIADFKHQSDPVIHAFELLRCLRPPKPAVWYHLFRAFSRKGFIYDSNRDQNENDEASWQLLELAVREFEETGISVDPDGFRHICICLNKAIVASCRLSNYTASSIINGPKLIREMFARLTERMRLGDTLPRLLYSFGGHHLHPYIRVLGVIQDVDEVLLVLEWMVNHQQELTRDAKLSKNGLKLLRRSLVAVRALFDHNEAKPKELELLKAVMVQLDQWGGWPTDGEVEHYLMVEKTSEVWHDLEAKSRLTETF